MQFNQPNTYDGLGFAERIGLAIEQEITYRNDKRLQRLLSAARLSDVDYSHPRGLTQSTVAALQTNHWISKGKTYLACALGHHACLHGYAVRYHRASRLFEQLTIAHGDGDGSNLKLLAQIAKADVIIIEAQESRASKPSTKKRLTRNYGGSP